MPLADRPVTELVLNFSYPSYFSLMPNLTSQIKTMSERCLYLSADLSW